MEPLRLFGIPITKPGYYMNCVLTTAQIELIAADVSVVDYNYGDKKKKKVKGEYDNTEADAEQVKKAAKEWKDRYGEGENAGWVDAKNLLGGMTAEHGVNIG